MAKSTNQYPTFAKPTRIKKFKIKGSRTRHGKLSGWQSGYRFYNRILYGTWAR